MKPPAPETEESSPRTAPFFSGELAGVGPARKRALAEVGFSSAEDILWWLPSRYEDRRFPTPIGQLKEGQTALVRARVLGGRTRRIYKRGLSLTEAIVSDGSGNLHVVWFNQPWMERSLTVGTEVCLFGKVVLFSTRAGLRLQMDNPSLEKADAGAADLDRVVPIYRKVAGIPGKQFRRIVLKLLDEHPPVESLPLQLRESERLPNIGEAFRMVHFPEEPIVPGGGAGEVARKRLAMEELLAVQCVLGEAKRERALASGVMIPATREAGLLLRRILPFSLTGAQRRAFREIASDLASSKPMYRLLQGDVGSGKTIVAFLAMAWAAQSGFQAAFMAPTEILARQQAERLAERVAADGMEVALLTASVTGRARRQILERLASGGLRLVVGTQSLFQEKVLFNNLGLVIIDEQHRFGVEQRARMVAKGRSPNVLVMTATPIPRSLALTLYGDLDLSVLDEKPPGRIKVVTKVRDDSAIRKIEAFCRTEMDGGGQVFFVFPLVEESEDSDTEAAVQAYERLTQGPFRGYPAALLHGRMNGPAKEKAVAAVRQGKAKLLVSTTVVEVGVDLPEASAMVVMHADRFGLAQLHQLRGRIGRSGQQGYCILMASAGASKAAVERLSVLEKSDDGFEIAEADLRSRGAGDIGGLRQWGGGGFRVANPIRDKALLESARRWAEKISRGEISWKAEEKERFGEWVRSWSGRLGSWGPIG